jgi:hypothetical protein
MKALFSPFVGRMLVLVRSLGPYAAIELLLPGGSLLALLYWWYQHRLKRGRGIPERGAQFEERPLRESLFGRKPPHALRRHVSRAGARSAEGRLIARGQPRAAPRSSCRAAAA